MHKLSGDFEKQIRIPLLEGEQTNTVIGLSEGCNGERGELFVGYRDLEFRFIR